MTLSRRFMSILYVHFGMGAREYLGRNFDVSFSSTQAGYMSRVNLELALLGKGRCLGIFLKYPYIEHYSML